MLGGMNWCDSLSNGFYRSPFERQAKGDDGA